MSSPSFLNTNLKNKHGYTAPDSTHLIKLDAMEMPDAFVAPFLDQMHRSLPLTPINRYPNNLELLKKNIAQRFELDGPQQILLGNGSDELIQIILLGLQYKRPILLPKPTFSMYKILCDNLGIACIEMHLNAQYQLDANSMLNALSTHQPAAVFLATPNNPTGNIFHAPTIENCIHKHPNTLFVIDQAYQVFASEDHTHRWLKYKNVVVMRTLSKMGFAGLRFGFLLGHTCVINAFHGIKLPYNISSYTASVAQYVLENWHQATCCIQRLLDQKKRLHKQLEAFDFLHVHPSEANFFLVTVKPSYQAEAIYNHLWKSGIAVKYLHPTIQDALRITIGDSNENNQLIRALRGYDCE